MIELNFNLSKNYGLNNINKDKQNLIYDYAIFILKKIINGENINTYKYLDNIIKNSWIKSIEDIIKNSSEETVETAKYNGWINYDQLLNDSLISEIKNTGKILYNNSDYIIAIGIGGSYLGARAIYEIFNNNDKLLFAGNNLSSYEISKIIHKIKNKNFSIIVISKSGTTTETSIAFRIFFEKLKKKYPENFYERIIFITDKEKGALNKYSKKYKIKKFVIPENIGGRFSVFTPVGLLPLASAGIEIDKIVNTIKQVLPLLRKPIKTNPAINYAVIRNLLYFSGKNIEFFISYEDSLKFFIEWIKQLLGESEGKEGRGILPSGALFTTDLHSLGQYLQQGVRNIFETVFYFENYKDLPGYSSIIIPFEEDNYDNFNLIANKKIEEINKIAFYSTAIAHYEGLVPINIVKLNNLSIESITELMLFFMVSTGISGILYGINPFDQPGVEEYKLNMKALIGFKNLEQRKNELEKKINKLFF